MGNSDDFFQQLKPAAVLKHAVLEGYVKIYATMTGSTGSGTVWVIDAYAGPGQYEADGESPGAPGSPRIVSDLAEDLSKKGRRLRGAFIEAKRSFADQLRSVVGTSGEHLVFHGDAATHLEAALAAAGSDPVLLFLDPFGVSLSLDLLVDSIKKRPADSKTEVLLNFNIEAVSRIGGILESKKPQPHDEKTLARGDAFLGGTWWREEFVKARRADDDASAFRAAEAVAAKYQASVLQRLGLRAVHVPVRRRVGSQPFFLLTLFTSYSKAQYIFTEVASGANQKWREFHRQKALAEDVEKYSTSLFPEDFIESESEAKHREAEAALDVEWVGVIKASIKELLKSHEQLVVATDVVEIYGPAVTLAREKHLRQAWDELDKEEVVQPRIKSQKLRDQVIKPRLAVAVASRSK